MDENAIVNNDDVEAIIDDAIDEAVENVALREKVDKLESELNGHRARLDSHEQKHLEHLHRMDDHEREIANLDERESLFEAALEKLEAKIKPEPEPVIVEEAVPEPKAEEAPVHKSRFIKL